MRTSSIVTAATVAATLGGCAPRGAALPVPHDALVSTGERSGFTRTGRYAEAVALCHAFARAYPGVTCDSLGDSAEGRAIVAVRTHRAGAHAPVIYVQAGIHAGEIEGKDAGFLVLRDLLDGKVAPGALAAVDLVFVPIVNPDGHERFGPNQRPNQRGPVEGGFRTTGARLNMNRDFVKLDAPETRAVVRFLAREQPVLFVDLHTTDSAKFQQDISINVTPIAPRTGDHLAETGASLSSAIATRLTARGHLPLEFYPSFVTEDDPTSGFEHDEAPPRFGHFYYAARSHLAALIETHSWRTYAERVRATYDALAAIFELAPTAAPAWVAAERDAARADLALAGHDVPLVWETGPHTTTIAFAGYAYRKVRSEISGGDWIVYDETTPETWHVPLRDELVPTVSVAIPAGGWIVDGGFAAEVARVLDLHGLAYRRLGEPAAPLAVDVFRATAVTPDGMFEGRARVQLAGAWTRETRALERGAIFVPSHQADVRLVAHLLDPALPDSLAQWGTLSAAFERKEYMESYVIEQIARDMLATDPALADAFARALAADPALAKSPAARLDWFYRRSPAWDEHVNLLPIFRVDHEIR